MQGVKLVAIKILETSNKESKIASLANNMIIIVKIKIFICINLKHVIIVEL